MKRLILCLVLMVSVVAAWSQKVYFIYIQADLEQPFSVKMNEKLYHSSSAGYLILSKLKDSSYPVTVTFPQNKWPDQSFNVEIKSKDRGFLLKNFGEKGWGLYDLQSLNVQMSTTGGTADKPRAEVYQVSAFTEVLSKAANDPSLRERPIAAVRKEEPIAVQPAVVREEVKKEEPVSIKNEEPPVTNKEEPVVEKKEEVAAVKQEDPPAVRQVAEPEKKEEEQTAAAPEEYKPSVIKRKSESSTSEGMGLSFIDEYPDGKKDTISILIPNPPRRVIKGQPKKDKEFLEITADTKDLTPQVKPEVKEEEKKEKETKPAEIKATSGTCSSNASDNDFIKLRRKMVAESNDDDMVAEAVKYFKSKCFTVSQVKNLSNLFLNESGKYKFFDAAYNHVSYPDQFSSLQSELKDDYYINRFKAMIK
jgi:hypothetical protein